MFIKYEEEWTEQGLCKWDAVC